MPQTPPSLLPRVVVIGAGAVGCHLAASLRERCPVLMVDPSAAVLDGLARRGLRAVAPADLGGAEPALTPSDVPVVATSASVAVRAASVIPAGVPFCCVANGLVPELTTQRGSDIVFGVVEFAASSPAPGAPQRTKPGWLTLQDGPPASAGVRLARALDPRRQRARLSAAIDQHRHAKLLLNSSLDPVAAVIGGTIGGVFGRREAFTAFRALLREGLAVARASGWELTSVQGVHPASMIKIFSMPVLSRVSAKIASWQARAVESTLARELARGDVGEADQLCGAIVRQGARAGVPTPAHARALEVLGEIAREGRGGRPELAARLLHA